jgi:hypothetical protein
VHSGARYQLHPLPFLYPRLLLGEFIFKPGILLNVFKLLGGWSSLFQVQNVCYQAQIKSKRCLFCVQIFPLNIYHSLHPAPLSCFEDYFQVKMLKHYGYQRFLGAMNEV